jgi:hypothetical protein
MFFRYVITTPDSLISTLVDYPSVYAKHVKFNFMNVKGVFGIKKMFQILIRIIRITGKRYKERNVSRESLGTEHTYESMIIHGP